MGHFPSWMLQSARNYLKATEILDAQKLPHVAQVNATIGMEILLKSFILCLTSIKVRPARPTNSTPQRWPQFISICKALTKPIVKPLIGTIC
ncbi:hypothetical protein ABXV19_25115 [Pseudomonas alkylphenolica]|uniref:hypothetical protein n=1 Tax=Pseudomonas alkylphenolica TaxID=237609 RepID=UPI003398F582